jgi:hypothetical protein
VKTYYQRCKGLYLYRLETESYPVNSSRKWWEAWFAAPPDGKILQATGNTREDACRELWRKAVAAGLVKED